MKSYWQYLIRKYISIAIIISFFLLIINNLIALAFKPKLSLVHVSNIHIEGTANTGEETEIRISGYLCCPCYELHSHDEYFNYIQREVVIKLWQEQVADSCLQVIIYYNYIIDIVFPFSGNWKVRCNNKDISVIVYS